jgi:hypothetical protein
MSFKTDDFRKAGLGQTDALKAARLNSGAPGKESGSTNMFQALLSIFKPDQGGAPAAGGLRNKPASSQVIGSVRHAPGTVNNIRSSGTNAQSVNTLAASALIALSAVSSGRHCLDRFSGQAAGGAAPLSAAAASAIGAYQAASAAGGNDSVQAIGALSARFESGGGGPGVIGYDHNGGTSYGTYQISSRAGTMKLFIDYLSERAPDLARKLEAAGPANTGSRSGKMPAVWKELAAADPERFAKLQSDFIGKNLYLPTVQEISNRTGLDVSKAPKALQEVLWSTAVQHGSRGAANIFTKAIRKVESKNDQLGMAKLIDAVYNMRANRFGSSGAGIRAAVRSRFREEGRMALAMLSNETPNASAMRA